MTNKEIYDYVSARVSEELDKSFKRAEKTNSTVEIKTIDIKSKIHEGMTMEDVEKLISEIVEDISNKIWAVFREKIAELVMSK